MKMSKLAKALPVVAAVALAGTAFQVQAAEPDSGKSINVLQGKCGSGKCGTARVREMMDTNTDGSISKDEYMSWSAKQAAKEFDELSSGAGNTSPEKVYDSFKHWQDLVAPG